MVYIQRYDGDASLETIDEFTTMAEAETMVIEYQLSDRSARYYTSLIDTRER